MRVGLFGGAFDPVHLGHLILAEQCREQGRLDQVWFLPTAHPPHKPESTGAGFEDRFRMVELACGLDPRFEPSRIEAGEEKSYSIVTVEKIRPTVRELYFIIGADAFAEIATWYRWQDLLRLTDFIVVTRPGHHYECPPGARVHRLDTLALPVSSSEIRQQLAQGNLPPELPPKVAEYIAGKGLYDFPR